MTLLGFDNSQHLSSEEAKNNEEILNNWSTAVQLILPVAALALLWGRKRLFSSFRSQLDNCTSVLCPSLNKRQRLLKWISNHVQRTCPTQSETLIKNPVDFWRDGSLLCTLINSVIPGACPNPRRHRQQPPSHGQALVYKYLGIAPVCADKNPSESDLTPDNERAFLHYLLQVQQELAKLSTKEIKFCSHYVARGMGLITGESNRKSIFYIYCNSPTLSNCNLIVTIRSPYNVYSTMTIPTSSIDKKLVKQKLNELKRLSYRSRAQSSLFKSISVDFDTANVSPEQDPRDEIPMKLVKEAERVKIAYVPKASGIHEISIINDGFHLMGSPFVVNVTKGSEEVIETLSDEEMPRLKPQSGKSIRKRILSRIIDIVDQKVTYENLKAIPGYLKRIPAIKVTKNDDQTVSDESNGAAEEIHQRPLNQVKSRMKTGKDVKQTGTFVTSPICRDHIGKEVRQGDRSASPEISESNFGKRPSDAFANSALAKKRINEIINAFNANDTDLGGREADESVCTKSFVPNCSEKTDHDVKAQQYDSILKLKSELDSLNNSHVKSDSGTFSFFDALHYWEDLAGLSAPLAFKESCFRRSLPNLFASSRSASNLTSLYVNKLESSSQIRSTCEFNSLFKERQQYWKTLSVQSDLNGSLGYLESVSRYFTRSRIGSRQSMPNLFTNIESDVISREVGTIDFYKSSEAFNFRDRFRKCREYWENMSVHNLDAFQYFDDHDDGDRNKVETFNSLPNLYTELIKETNVERHKIEYKDVQDYWERLSYCTGSTASLNSYAEDNKGFKLGRKSQCLPIYVRSKNVENGLGFKSLEPLKEDGTVQDCEGVNLTDDLKSVDRLQISYKKEFVKAKEYFVLLENGERESTSKIRNFS